VNESALHNYIQTCLQVCVVSFCLRAGLPRAAVFSATAGAYPNTPQSTASIAGLVLAMLQGRR
jgi:hypothetical protein